MAAFVACLALAASAAAQTYDAAHQELVASATNEGTVAVLSTTDAAEVAELLAGFRSLYPGIRLDYVDGNSTAIDETVRRETDAGSGTVDLVWSSAMDLQLKLVNDGYAQPYASPALGSLPRWAVWKNEAYGVTAEPVAIVYNKRLLPPEEAPRSHADLLRLLRDRAATISGRIATYDPERSSVGYLFLTQDVLVTDRSWSLIGTMGQARVRLYASTGEMLDRVAAGEQMIAYDVIGSYATDRARRTPELGVVLPADYTLVMSRVAVIAKRAPHPSAARLFLDHLLSASGQRALAARAIGPVRGDVATDAAAVAPPQSARPIQLGPRLLAYLDQAKRARFLRDWRAALGEPGSR